MKFGGRYPALVISGIVAVASAIAAGVIFVPQPWASIALGVVIFAGGLGIHTQASPARQRRGKVR